LKTAFSRVYSCLKKGGVFIFDVSSPYKLKNLIGNNLFAEDNEDLTYLWFNKLDGDRVIMDLTFFERQGEKYLRSDERHVQYIHEEDELCAALNGAGFSVQTEGHLGKDKTERINFICTRL
ncbi:MAG: class I SAM-dependent methyltransferase, partial [Clostridia bacterium]|nr:class I SAM-dependent methyltransferase [Clostridia bacterium]